jgi:hypothetical protein
MSQRLRSTSTLATRYEQDFARIFSMGNIGEDLEPKIGWSASASTDSDLDAPGDPEAPYDDEFAAEDVFTTAMPRSF